VSTKYVVAPVDEYPPGTKRIIRVHGREIGIFRVDDEFYAVRNRCPHQGGPLCVGHVRRRIVADAPGSFAIDDGPPLVVCPWHGWQYDARTGEAYAPGDPHVRSYRVAVEAGAAVSGEAGESGPDVPFVAETFPVYLEDDYIVIEI
jgi:nitrite reductase/ring-hydroxylating ferredoxin subunit